MSDGSISSQAFFNTVSQQLHRNLAQVAPGGYSIQTNFATGHSTLKVLCDTSKAAQVCDNIPVIAAIADNIIPLKQVCLRITGMETPREHSFRMDDLKTLYPDSTRCIWGALDLALENSRKKNLANRREAPRSPEGERRDESLGR